VLVILVPSAISGFLFKLRVLVDAEAPIANIVGVIPPEAIAATIIGVKTEQLSAISLHGPEYSFLML
jgi:hypothetical protein